MELKMAKSSTSVATSSHETEQTSSQNESRNDRYEKLSKEFKVAMLSIPCNDL